MTHPEGPTNAGWTPTSPCSDRCTRSGADVSGWPSWGRAGALAVALVLVLLAAAATAPLLVLATPEARGRWLQITSRAALTATGVKVSVRRLDLRGHGFGFGPGGVLVVANHMSWIEILALCSVAPVRLIAKREVRQWPLVGALAGATGALFIDRHRLRELPGTVTDVTAALRAGNAVAVFPEGTTWCGAAAGPFHRAPFQAAVDAATPIQPVAVTLRRRGRPAHGAAFVGDQTLLTSVAQVMRLSALVCELTLLPVIRPDGDRAELASRAAGAIASATGVPHPARPGGPAVVRRREKPLVTAA